MLSVCSSSPGHVGPQRASPMCDPEAGGAGLLTLGQCQDMPEVSWEPRVHLHTLPCHPQPCTTPQPHFWAAKCWRGPFPPPCRCSQTSQPLPGWCCPVPRVPWDEGVAAEEEGSQAGASRSQMAEGEVQAALPEGNPPPARLQGPAKGEGHPAFCVGSCPCWQLRTGMSPAGLVSAFPQSGTCLAACPEEQGGRAGVRMFPN